VIDTIYFETEEPLNENSFVMDYYLDHINMLDVTFVDGTYAEGVNSLGKRYGIHAGGNGDDLNHKIEFEEL
jgi:hypothetical protein